MKLQLLKEEWFHGPISREDAENLLQNVNPILFERLWANCYFLFLKDGDFLVRESKGSTGQYVLTGMQSNSKKHLLLVDPEGIVRKTLAFLCDHWILTSFFFAGSNQRPNFWVCQSSHKLPPGQWKANYFGRVGAAADRAGQASSAQDIDW